MMIGVVVVTHPLNNAILPSSLLSLPKPLNIPLYDFSPPVLSAS